MFYSEPVLRLPLLLYHLWIISPSGRRAVAHSRASFRRGPRELLVQCHTC